MRARPLQRLVAFKLCRTELQHIAVFLHRPLHPFIKACLAPRFDLDRNRHINAELGGELLNNFIHDRGEVHLGFDRLERYVAVELLLDSSGRRWRQPSSIALPAAMNSLQ